MALFRPQFVVLDSSTIGKVSKDYWSSEMAARRKARTFLDALSTRGVHVTFALTHVFELLRHGNEKLVRERLEFLRRIPLIAWLRPYDRSWFPGNAADLFVRELHALQHGNAHNWREIVDEVQPDLWETGTGAEMFVEDDPLWEVIRREAIHQLESEKYIASIARTNPGNISDLTIAEAHALPKRTNKKRPEYMAHFVTDMRQQLDQRGDKRLQNSREIAIGFARDTLKRVEAIDSMGGDPLTHLMESAHVPQELLHSEMTIDEFGDLAVYAKQLQLFSENLKPPAFLSMSEVPINRLPSYFLEWQLTRIQHKAERARGSDLGDRHLAALVFYADGIDVDVRTFQYLTQLQRANLDLAKLMRPFFSTADYSQIPGRFD